MLNPRKTPKQKPPERSMLLDVQGCLPIVATSFLNEAMKNAGYTIRQDMLTLCARSFDATLTDVDMLYRGLCLSKAGDDMIAVFRAANVDHLETIWAAHAHMVLKLAAKGFAIEKRLFMVCAAIETELEEDTPRWGAPAVIDRAAGKMENEARRLGYWWMPNALDLLSEISA